jgi:hypothetical protein
MMVRRGCRIKKLERRVRADEKKLERRAGKMPTVHFSGSEYIHDLRTAIHSPIFSETLGELGALAVQYFF